MDDFIKMFNMVSPLIRKTLTTQSLSMAILDDYCEKMSKLENRPVSEIRKRVESRYAENFRRYQKEFFQHLKSLGVDTPETPEESSDWKIENPFLEWHSS